MTRIIDLILWWLLPEWLYRKLPDHCEICYGAEGGVRGNENVVDGIIMCDYCSVRCCRREVDRKLAHEITKVYMHVMKDPTL